MEQAMKLFREAAAVLEKADSEMASKLAQGTLRASLEQCQYVDVQLDTIDSLMAHSYKILGEFYKIAPKPNKSKD